MEIKKKEMEFDLAIRDEHGNIVRCDHRTRDPVLEERDENGNTVHLISGEEEWREYDANGKLVHLKSSTGYEEWYEYDDDGNEVFQKVQRCQGKME